MKKSLIIHPLIPCLLALLLVPACSRHSPEALAPDKIPGALNQAFSQATGATKDAAAQAAAACQKQDAVAAFTSLQDLARQKDLTPEQRSIAARASVTCFKEVQAAASQGDVGAQAVLHQYLSTR